MPPSPPDRWEGLEVLARGANRLCARDPVNPAHCLKFELAAPERTRAGLRARLRRWLGRRFPSRGDNAVEFRAWRQLQRKHGDALQARFAACHAVVPTRWGPALRCDCVLQEDGTPAPSLFRVMFGSGVAPGDAPSPLKRLLQDAVCDFEGFLVEHGIPLFDLNAGNFVVVPGDGGIRLVCVDAKSTVSGKELIPISRWIPWLRRRKVRRRAERLRQRIRSA